MGIDEVSRHSMWSLHRGRAMQGLSRDDAQFVASGFSGEAAELPQSLRSAGCRSDGRSLFRQPAIFLDRDGVINPTVLNPATGRMESPLVPADVFLADGAIEALFRLRARGYPLILVSNQPNFALGKSSLEGLTAIHHKLVYELVLSGITFARFCYCLHHPKGVTPGYSGLCVCRKPSPWFLLRARDDFGFSLADSWMIGDQPSDTQCGKAAGARTIRIDSQAGSHDLIASEAAALRPDYFVRNLLDAVEIIFTHPTA